MPSASPSSYLFLAADVVVGLIVAVGALYLEVVNSFKGDTVVLNALAALFGLLLTAFAIGRAWSCSERACAPCIDARELNSAVILERGLTYAAVGIFNSQAERWYGPACIGIAVLGALYVLTAILMSCQRASSRLAEQREQQMRQAIEVAKAWAAHPEAQTPRYYEPPPSAQQMSPQWSGRPPPNKRSGPPPYASPFAWQ